MMEIRLKTTNLELLFVCLCLLTVLGPANGETVVRVNEGSEAVLPCFIKPERDITGDAFGWIKDDQEDVFSYMNGSHHNNGREGQDEQFKGRVSHFPEQLQVGDASIKINTTKLSDSGNYICLYSSRDIDREASSIFLVVVTAVVKVTEGSEAVLPCFIRPKKDITQNFFAWFKDDFKEAFSYENGSHYNNGREGQDEHFKGRVSHFPDQLQFGDASIKINNTKPSDGGFYVCDFSPYIFDRPEFFIKLVVDCVSLKDRSGENIRGACPKPSVTALEATNLWAQLQCEVRDVSPKPKVKFQDSSGNILTVEEPQVTERGDSYDIILNTTVTETGNYSCVVTQDEICHQVSEKIFVNITGSQKETKGDEEKNPSESVELKNVRTREPQ